MRYALSLDGGGVRGAVEARLLSHIEDATQRRFTDIFEVKGGASTGSLVILLGEKGYSASQICDFYLKHSDKIFPKDMWWGIKTCNGYTGPKYDVSYLEKVSKEMMEDTTLRQINGHVMVPTYCLEDADSYFFKSTDEKDLDTKLRDIGLSSSAAPTFLAPHIFQDKGYIDGGTHANNPSMLVLTEALTIFGWDDIVNGNVKVLSLGGGDCKNCISSKQGGWGIFGWLKRGIFDVSMRGQSRDIDYMANAWLRKINYLRINEESFGITGFDDGSSKNLKACIDFADCVWVKRGKEILDFLGHNPLAKL